MAASHPPRPPGPPVPDTRHRTDGQPVKPPYLGRLLFVVVALATLGVGYRLVATLALSPRTYDAAIDADLVPISSPVPGRLIELAVTDNHKVTAGDLLFRIDPETYRLELAQAEAELAVVEATLADQRRLREAERANATVAQDQVRRAQSNLDLARRTAERLAPMESQAYISRQTLDEARTAVRDAEISWQQALGAAQAAENQVQSTQALEAQVRANRAQVAIASRALAQTEVRAPVTGRIVGLKNAAGGFVLPGQSLFSLIDTATWCATGLFRETDLTAMREGDPADVFVMIDKSIRIPGTLESIGWGIISEDEITALGNLPYVARSLNWVRVAARFPVRIRLQAPPEDLMRIGASAVVILHEQRPRD